jgi:hypothetical protein
MKIHPHDDIFRGARSYAEVLARIQALAPEERADVFKFQEHRRSCLPPVLRGENPTTVEVQQKEAEGSKDSTPRPRRTPGQGRANWEPENRNKDSRSSKSQTQLLLQGNHLSKSESHRLHYSLTVTKGNIDAGWIFNEELRPIRMEELPPNEFFFDKKRKVVVKREFYQEGDQQPRNLQGVDRWER